MHWPPTKGSESTTSACTSSRPSSNTANSATGPAPTISASVSIGAAAAAAGSSATVAAARRLADQLVELAGAVLPLVRVGQPGLAPGDARPGLRQLGVEGDHVL